VKAGWIKHGSARGQWIYGPEPRASFRTFEQIRTGGRSSRPAGYSEMIFPKLDTWDVLEEVRHCPESIRRSTSSAQPRPAIRLLLGKRSWTTTRSPRGCSGAGQEKIDVPIGGMCYAQCPPSGILQGMTLPNAELPIRVFDRSGTSHRYESGGHHGIERVDEFHRIEDRVAGNSRSRLWPKRKKLKERYKHIFEDILGAALAHGLGHAWFMAQEGKIRPGRRCPERGRSITKAVLPYNGNWVEFQNLSVNGESIPRAFP